MNSDPGKLARDYPAQPFENTLRGLQDLDKRISLNPHTLAEAAEATQQWNEILKEVTASYGSCTISQRQYDEVLHQIYPRLRDDAGELEQMREAAANPDYAPRLRFS